MISTIKTLHTPLTRPFGISKFDKDGIAQMFIQICGPCAMWIERNDPLGYAKELKPEEKAEKLNKRFLSGLMQDIQSSIEQSR
jgi:hypothetical protein